MYSQRPSPYNIRFFFGHGTPNVRIHSLAEYQSVQDIRTHLKVTPISNSRFISQIYQSECICMVIGRGDGIVTKTL